MTRINEQSFSEKVVLISGAAGGIGREMVTQLLALDCKVVALDLNVDELPADNYNLLAICCDITDSDKLKQAVDKTISHFGQLDLLINNAGITHRCRFSEFSTELFDTIMAVNFTAAVNLTRYSLPHLIQSKGQIAAISSVAGFAPLYGRSAYSASKHAMQGFFGSLGSELEEEGVTITIVCPAFVKSRPEIKAKTTSGLLSPGANKENPSKDQLEPRDAVLKILEALSKRQSYLYLGNISKVARYLFTLFPALYLKIMLKQNKL